MSDNYVCIITDGRDSPPCLRTVEMEEIRKGGTSYVHYAWVCPVHGFLDEDQMYLLSREDKIALIKLGDDRWITAP